jgi:hypothetical protein
MSGDPGADQTDLVLRKHQAYPRFGPAARLRC